MLGIFVTCFMLVALPIVAVQYPRFFQNLSSEATAVDTQLDGAGDKTASEAHKIQGTAHSSTTSGYNLSAPRKPWDPPFPVHLRSGRETYRVLRPSLQPVQNGIDGERMDVVEDRPVTGSLSNPPSINPCDDPVPAVKEPMSSADLVSATSNKTHGSHLSLLHMVILCLAILISVLAFAILIAHCLAWFIVYKTESRLGEVRKGLLRGGDMRVCLCAHG